MWVKSSEGNLINVTKARKIRRTEDKEVVVEFHDETFVTDFFEKAENAQAYIDELYKKLTFNGWLEDTKGVLRNLKMAHKIEVGTSAGKSRVYATFALSNKTNDPAFYEMATFATFDDEKDAVKYRDELKELLNGGN